MSITTNKTIDDEGKKPESIVNSEELKPELTNNNKKESFNNERIVSLKEASVLDYDR